MEAVKIIQAIGEYIVFPICLVVAFWVLFSAM
jgi:hypothetical protein